MQKFLKGTNEFLFVVAVTLLTLLIYFNKYYFQDSKLPKMRRFSETYRGFAKGGNFTGNITKPYSTKFNTCAEIIMPPVGYKANMINGYWQPVNKRFTAFVFSAYFIHERRKIVVIAMIRKAEAESYFCQFWHKGDGQHIMSYQTHADLNIIREGRNRMYTAALFECLLHPSFNSPPSYVSMVDTKCTSPMNIMSSQHVNEPEAFIRNFTVCLSPLHRKIDIYRFIEWIELNKILGADMFFIYNGLTNNKKLNKVLKFYSKKGLINNIHWKLPKGGTRFNVHYYGQVAALNDCLYRNKYESEYIVNIDLDEYIIPHIENETSWLQMFTHVNKTELGFIARNTIFKQKLITENIESSNTTVVEKYKLITLQKVKREEKVDIAGRRSKYISRTSPVHSVKIHGVRGIYTLPVNVGLLHHYREKQIKNDENSSVILDRTVPNKFSDVLIQKVANVWTELNGSLSADNMQ